MAPLHIETARLRIVPFTEQMADSVCRNSLHGAAVIPGLLTCEFIIC